MKRTLGIIMAVFVVFALAMPLSSAWFGGIEGDDYDDEITSGWAIAPAELDGIIEEDEYDNATMVDIDYYPELPHRNDTIYIYFMNDADFLYVGVDLLPDNTSDEGDFAALVIDEDNDDNFEVFEDGDEGLYYIEMVQEAVRAETAGLYPEVVYPTKPFMYATGFDTSVNDEDVEHRMWEFAIPIQYMDGGDVELGDTVKVGLCGYGTLSPIWEYPINGTIMESIDSTDWAELTLAEEPEPDQTGIDAEEEASYTFGVIMGGFGLIASMMMLMFHKELILKPIADGKVKTVLIMLGIVVVSTFLSIADFYYDIGSMLGI